MKYAMRKIIKNNKVFKVALPPFWVREHNLERGRVNIEITQNGTSLLITPVKEEA